jgi:hypothetical protein
VLTLASTNLRRLDLDMIDVLRPAADCDTIEGGEDLPLDVDDGEIRGDRANSRP